MRWVDLLDDPVRLEVELARAGTDPGSLAADTSDVPELRSRLERLTSERARLWVALDWFGDQQQPQPLERTDWYQTGRTPDFGRLHRLDEPDQPREKRPRHRPPKQLDASEIAIVGQELRRRAEAGKPKTGPLTLDAIATRTGWPRPRVRQAEQLLETGWPLLRSHPEFSTAEGYVRWPTPKEAAQLLASR